MNLKSNIKIKMKNQNEEKHTKLYIMVEKPGAKLFKASNPILI